MPLTLAIDASTYSGSVAVVDGNAVLASLTVAMRGDREERLFPAVVEVLRIADAVPHAIRRVACGAGPGSFTSLRIAASIAKGLAVSCAAPLVAIPSLALLAVEAVRLHPATVLDVALDAMRGEWFVSEAHFTSDGRLRSLSEPELRPAAAIAAAHSSAEQGGGRVVAGPGLTVDVTPHARASAVLLADARFSHDLGVDAALWEPLYGRPAEAQARWELAHGRALASVSTGA